MIQSAGGILHAALCIRRTRTDADGRGRTRTDADGRGHLLFFNFVLILIFLFLFFLAYIIGARPRVRPLGSPPPPPHASWSYEDIYSLPVKPVIYFFLDFAMYTVYTPGDSFHMHMCRQNAPLLDDFSLAGHLKNGHLLSICPTNSQASQIIIDQ